MLKLEYMKHTSKTGEALPKAGALRRQGDQHNTRRIGTEGLRNHQGLTHRNLRLALPRSTRTASNGGTIIAFVLERTVVVLGEVE